MGIKAKAKTVTVSVTALLAWAAIEIYQLKQEMVENTTKIESLEHTQHDHRDSVNELIKLHLR